MANFFDDVSGDATTRNQSATPQGAGGGNFFDDVSSGVSLNNDEQQVIGQVNSVKLQTPETFGLTTIPKDLGKGLARYFGQAPGYIGKSLVQAGEDIEGFSGKGVVETAKASLRNRFIEHVKEDGEYPNIYEMIPIIFGVEKDVALNLAFAGEGSKVTKAGYNMIKENHQSLESMGLIPKGETSVAYDVGMGLGSVLTSIGATVLTKNPAVAAGIMGWMVNGDDYMECRKAGKSPEACTRIAATSAAGQAGVEFVGSKFFLGAAKGSTFVKSSLKRIAGQSGEEIAQSLVEQGVKNVTDVRDSSATDIVQEALYAGMIGAMAGAPVATVVSGIESYSRKLGAPEKEAKKLGEIVGEKYNDLEDLAAAFMDKETSGLGTNPAQVEESKRAVNEVIQAKELEITQAQEAKAATQQAQTEEVKAQVENVTSSVSNAVDSARNVTQEIRESVSPEILSSIDERLANLENEQKLFTEEVATVSVDQSKARLESIDNSINEIGVILENEGVDQVKISALKDTQRQLRSSALQAERIIGQIDRAATQEQVAPDAVKQQDYDLVAKGTTQSRTKVVKGKVKDVASGTVEMGSDVFTPISTRLAKINGKLRTAVRRYTFNTGLHNTRDKNAIKPFIEALRKMSVEDYRVLDFALKNQDIAKVDELLQKYNLAEDFKTVRQTLNQIFDEAKEVGLDLNYIEEYFPRQVKRDKVTEYLAVLRGRDDWTLIQQALDEADPEKVFTDVEKAEFINKHLRGFASSRIQLAASGFTKERSVDYVTPELNQYYESSPTALINYVDGMRFGIEARRLFGKDKAEGSIGDYVRQLVDEGTINSKNEEEVKKILRALVDQQGTRGVVTWAKNASYIYVMGSPISAITQIGDLAFSLAENGYYNTGKALGKAILRKSNLTKEDIGIENILQEFDGESTSAKAVRTVFKLVGLEYMDNIGKETTMNAALLRLQKQAKNDTPEFRAYMEEIFGNEANQVAKDVINGIATENVKFLIFSELSDVQPISLAEMPVSYLNSGNGRVFYMLKTYTLKLLDIHRRKWIDEVASGDKKRMAKGVRNLTRLSAALMIMGMAADTIKNIVMDRDFEVDELFLENIIKMTGISRYQIYKSKREGIMATFWRTLFVPPIGAPVDDLSKDLSQIGLGDKKLKDAEVAQRVPVVGKLYYWWFGGGKRKEKRKRKTTGSTL